MGVVPKVYFKYDILRYMKYKTLITTKYRGFIEHCDSVGRIFNVARSNHVVKDYKTELLQIIIALEPAYLNISDYSCSFDGSYSLLK